MLYGEDGSGAFGRGPVSYVSASELREKIRRVACLGGACFVVSSPVAARQGKDRTYSEAW